MDRDNELLFMNYGYAYLDGNKTGLVLEEPDKKHRYCIQLYHHLTDSLSMSSADVLDIGCGRGGGSSFIARYLGPRKIVGLDYSWNAVDFCTSFHSRPNLSFSYGTAEALPFAGDTFDYVLNVESSRCYRSMAGFLGQVGRVLRPGGYFLFADFRDKEQIPDLEGQFASSGLKLVAWELITENVLRAMELDHDRKCDLVRRKAPPLMTRILADLIGTKDSWIYRRLQSRDIEYIRCALQKA
jgi:SAM-dependent methyltransferase